MSLSDGKATHNQQPTLPKPHKRQTEQRKQKKKPDPDKSENKLLTLSPFALRALFYHKKSARTREKEKAKKIKNKLLF